MHPLHQPRYSVSRMPCYDPGDKQGEYSFSIIMQVTSGEGNNLQLSQQECGKPHYYIHLRLLQWIAGPCNVDVENTQNLSLSNWGNWPKSIALITRFWVFSMVRVARLLQFTVLCLRLSSTTCTAAKSSWFTEQGKRLYNTWKHRLKSGKIRELYYL